MKRLTTTLAAALFCLSAGFAFAQQGPGGPAGPGGPGGAHRFKPCSQEADAAKCEADRKQMRENLRAAQEACEDASDKRACVTQNYCAKQADPAKCQALAKEHQQREAKRMDERQAIAEACTGKRGEDLQKCYREHRPSRRAPQPEKKG
jgi:hypothetical protein